MRKHEEESGKSQAESTTPDGSDGILDGMIRRGEPLTRERYLLHAYPGRDFEEQPLEAEEQAMIPDRFQE